MASPAYIVVTDDETKADRHVEVPLESNYLLRVSTLEAQFPAATGLKFRAESGAFRGLRASDGYLHPPSEEGWGTRAYVVVLKAEPAKRKSDATADGAPPAKSAYFQPQSAGSSGDLIVLGLPWKATTADLQQYFSQYGQLAVCQVNLNREGQSRGFGFIRYYDASVNEKVLTTQFHYVLGRRCEVKLPSNKSQTDVPRKKLFVGCLGNHITKDDLLNHFSSFGIVTDIYIPTPFRGFAFVTFADNVSAARALQVTSHVVQGTQVNVTTPEARKGPPPGAQPGLQAHQQQQALASQAIFSQLALAAATGQPGISGYGMDMSALGLQAGQAVPTASAAQGMAASSTTARPAVNSQYQW